MLILGSFLSALEGTLLRLVSADIGAPMITVLRYSAATIFAVPFIIIAFKKHQVTFKQLLFLAVIAIPLVLDPLIWQYVVTTTNASFSSILSLTSPIIFVLVSTFITKDRISQNKILGFLCAVLGGLVMVLVPSLNNETALNFGITPVLLMLINGVLVSVVTIIWRKEDERGTPMIVVLGTFYFVWAIISGVLTFLLGDIGQARSVTINDVLIFVYLGAVASIAFNVIFTKYYTRVGTAAAATMKYFKRLLSILVPIMILGESLSGEIVFGAILIITGIVIAQKTNRRRKIAKH